MRLSSKRGLLVEGMSARYFRYSVAKGGIRDNVRERRLQRDGSLERLERCKLGTVIRMQSSS